MFKITFFCKNCFSLCSLQMLLDHLFFELTHMNVDPKLFKKGLINVFIKSFKVPKISEPGLFISVYRQTHTEQRFI